MHKYKDGQVHNVIFSPRDEHGGMFVSCDKCYYTLDYFMRYNKPNYQYNLSHFGKGTCPECGNPLSPEAIRKAKAVYG